MRRLSEKERRFVYAMVVYPTAKPSKWARLAGYSDASKDGLRIAGHYVVHRQRVLDAVAEETHKRVQFGGAIAIGGLVAIASDPKHRDHFRACVALADRAGFVPTQEINVRHEHTDMTGKAMAERIRELAAKHGLDPVKLLGGNAQTKQPQGGPDVVEGEFTEVKE